MSLSLYNGGDRFHRLNVEKRSVFPRSQGSGKDNDYQGSKRNLGIDGNVLYHCCGSSMTVYSDQSH